MSKLLDQLDTEHVRRAVAEAEEQTAGEIVPYVVERSGGYEVALWRGAGALALLAVGLMLLAALLYDGWGLAWLYTGWGVALAALAGGLLGAALTAFIAPLKRLLAGTERLDRTVHAQAMKAFVEEEVFATRDRTGILLFVSLFEHRIEVLGDSGINARVEPEAWAGIVERIRDGIRDGHFTDGLVEAIARCGALLERHGVEIRPDDENELPDRVRTRRDEPG